MLSRALIAQLRRRVSLQLCHLRFQLRELSLLPCARAVGTYGDKVFVSQLSML
jgi:hypothetical protein